MALIEAYGHAFVARQEDNLVAVSDAGGDELISLLDSDRVDAVGAHVHELAHRRFLYETVARGEEDVLVFFFEIAHRDRGLQCFAGLQADQVADVLATSGGADVRNFINLEPVDTAGVGEDQNVGVG